MKVKEAVQTAFRHVADLFGNGQIANLRLEEVEFDPESKEWRITVSFSRPWDYPNPSMAGPAANEVPPKREYKMAVIQAGDPAKVSIRNRPVDD